MDHQAEASQAARIPHVGALIRLWGIAATILSVLYTVVLSIATWAVCDFASGHWVTPLTNLWAWLIVRTCGIRVEVEGLENLAGLREVVLVSNHKSLIDIMAVVYAIPREVRFVAKREVKKIPLIGRAMEHSGHIIIDRQSGGREIRRGLKAMRDGYTICVFAEGHRFNDDLLHEFSDGAAWLAIATRLPCVPMAISGTLAVMRRGAWFVNPGRRIRLTLAKPIETKDLRSADRIALTRRLEGAVRAEFRAQI
jgi:1-acyl-sn-glycerol-3-phosphate acyltransferase